ncbi:hypothetical protein [Geobacter anodireducens]
MPATVNSLTDTGRVMQTEPVIIQDPPMCCGKMIDLFSVSLHRFKMELDGTEVTYLIPECPICGAIRRVNVEETFECGGTA